MDLRGHGDSDATFAAYDDPAAASDILALIEHLGGPALVIGNSMGAAAAVIAAAENPALVSGLVLIGPFVRNVPGAGLAAVDVPRHDGRTVGPAGLACLLPHLLPHPQGRRLRRAPRPRSARPWPVRVTAGRSGRPPHVSHAPAEAVLDRVSTDVLVVMGSKDPDFPDQQAEAELIAERLGGRVVMIPDAGHYPQSEFPELTTPVVLEFARTVTAGRADA